MSNKLRKIRLYGPLGVRFGREYNLAVSSPAEAVRALCKLLPGFEAYMMQAREIGMAFGVFVGKQGLSQHQLHHPSGDDTIRIAPITIGAKKQGWGQIILGLIIIVVSVVLDYWTGGAFGEATGYQTYYMGVAMILGGVIQLLSPQPKGLSSKDTPNNTPSYNFNGAVNTEAQGHPVPLGYGRLIVGSAVISASINTSDDQYVGTTASTGSGGGGGGGSGGGTGMGGTYANL